MAPSATETTTLPTHTNETSAVKLTGGVGPYKELAPIGYDKEAEEVGKEGFEAAHVRICLSSSYCSSKSASSILTTYHTGAVNDTPLLSLLSIVNTGLTQIRAFQSFLHPV